MKITRRELLNSTAPLAVGMCAAPLAFAKEDYEMKYWEAQAHIDMLEEDVRNFELEFDNHKAVKAMNKEFLK
jgi:hypothetical protein